MYRVHKKLEDRMALLGAGGDHRPGALTPTAAGLAPRPVRNPLRFGIMACVPQLQGAGRYRFATDRAREILGSLALECFQIVRPRGPPPGENLARVFWLLQGARLLTTRVCLEAIVFVVCTVRDNFSECF